MATETDPKPGRSAVTVPAATSSEGDLSTPPANLPTDEPRPGRSAVIVPAATGPESAKGLVEQTSPAPHVNDIVAAAALLKGTDVREGYDKDKAAKEAEVLGVHYQYAGQVRQLLAERANLIAYGNVDRLAGIETALDALGYTGDRSIGASSADGPLGRSSRSDRSVTTDTPTAGTSKSSAATATSTSTSTSGTSTGGAGGAGGSGGTSGTSGTAGTAGTSGTGGSSTSTSGTSTSGTKGAAGSSKKS
jgi:hypothetical protein